MSRADYTGQINAKKLGGTGVTEAILRRHHAAEAGRLMVVASISVAKTHKDVTDGTGAVDYVIDDLEVAPDVMLDGGHNPAEFLRELARSFHYERKIDEDGPTLDDEGIEPKVTDVLARGDAHKPHPFLPTDAAADNPTCEVCGLGENAAPHRADRASHPDDYPTEDPTDDSDQGEAEVHDTDHEANPGDLFDDETEPEDTTVEVPDDAPSIDEAAST